MSLTSQAANTADREVTTTDIALPPPVVSVSQDREWCVVDIGGEWKKIRFHDYDRIYKIPGLYETLFYDVLKCNSPTKIKDMLQVALAEAGVSAGTLQVLDLGAGNGMVGEQLADLGVRGVVGIDIITEAEEAARRDRDEFYKDYFVIDMTNPSEEDRSRLSVFGFNALTCVAALGFGDIPPAAFANAYNLVASGGWVAFNIKKDFLEQHDTCGFAGLIRRMIDGNVMSVVKRQEYQHRIATNGKPLLYTAMVGVKKDDIPSEWNL